LLAAGSPIAWAFPVRQGLISLSTGIGSFKYMPSIRTLQGSARNLRYNKSLIFRQGNKGLPATKRSRRRPRPEVVIGTTPVFSTGKIRQPRAGFDKDIGRDGQAVYPRLLPCARVMTCTDVYVIAGRHTAAARLTSGKKPRPLFWVASPRPPALTLGSVHAEEPSSRAKPLAMPPEPPISQERRLCSRGRGTGET